MSEIGGVICLLFLLVASTSTAFRAKFGDRPGHFVKYGRSSPTTNLDEVFQTKLFDPDGLSPGRISVHLFEGTSNATDPSQLVTFQPAPDVPESPLLGHNQNSGRIFQKTASKFIQLLSGVPIFKDQFKFFFKSLKVLGFVMKYLIVIPIKAFIYLMKFPFMVARTASALLDRLLPIKVRKEVSYLLIKLLTVVARIVFTVVNWFIKFVRWVKGDLCIYFPEIPTMFHIITAKGGRICPFESVDLATISIKENEDNWEVTLPFHLHNVELLFSTIQLSAMGMNQRIGGYNLTATEVDLDVRLHFTTNFIPGFLPLKSVTDTAISVHGCTADDPGSDWIKKELMKYASKLCDPVLNEISKVMMFTGKLNAKLLAWVYDHLFKNISWLPALALKLAEKIWSIVPKMLGLQSTINVVI